MIDLESAKKEFEKYISNYDLNNPEIERKVGHSFRVSKISEKIAKSLNLPDEEIEVATLIGLLHDIGKIDQRSEKSVYKDLEKVEHGEAAVKILEKDDYIRKYIEDSKYDNIIKTAIINHSKYEIEKKLDDKTLGFCKIIRDSDKLDILYQAEMLFWKNGTKVQDEITQNVIEEFYNQIKVHRENIETKIDGIISMISNIYDIYYRESFKMIKENDYINKIMDKFEIKNEYVKEQFNDIRNIANNYIEDKIKNMK